jgi:MarR family 2-MHQ and catechol resistance regulon transcriptional repressor
MDEKTQTSINLWEKMVQAYEAIKKAQVKTIFDSKLTIPQYSVLEVIYNQGPMPLKKIGEKLFVSGANITCVVDNLEKEDYVKRVPSNIDRRIIMAELTPKGLEKISKLYPQNAKNIVEVAANLSKDEQLTLDRLLTKLSGNNKG